MKYDSGIFYCEVRRIRSVILRLSRDCGPSCCKLSEICEVFYVNFMNYDSITVPQVDCQVDI